MKEYPKIQSVYKRDEKTKNFIEGQWSLPEFEYLKNNIWQWTEKVDGSNIRVCWSPGVFDYAPAPPLLEFKGKTDNADIPKFLLAKLHTLFQGELLNEEKLQIVFPDTPVCLYGEGYGARIQKGGGNYIPNGVSFVLFDVKIGEWWLKREDVEGIAEKLGIDIVPVIMEATIPEAIEIVRSGFVSTWSSHNASATSWCHEFKAEGLVGKPKVEMRSRNGQRIITKLKTRDFYTRLEPKGGAITVEV